VILGIFGYLINVLYRMFEKRVLHWYHAMIAQTQGASA
jgi:ABC-type nitrate/sulfonate/bicarbonate transport system permease component